MPVYEYECGECDRIFEVQQRIADEPITICPECGGEVRKLISRSSFQLKGGGWYAEGYSGPSNGKGGESCPSSPAAATAGSAPPCQGGGCCHCPAAT
jgi:putative FmdB family regulatory protein